MPYKRKRPYRKRRRRRQAKYQVARTMPMPKKFVTTLRYAEHGLSVNPGAGLVADYMFRANDVFDPNYSGVGHQPRGFDQIMPLYNHFTVIGSRCKIQVTNTADAAFYTCFLALQGEPTVTLNPIDYMERQDVVTKTVGSKSADPMRTLTYNFSTKKFFSKSNVLDDTTLRGSAAASPSEVAYYHFGAVESDGGDPGAIYFNIIIDYIVCFHETNDVASS